MTNQEELEENSQRSIFIIKSSDDAIISMDLNGTITSWNNGAEVLSGYSPAEAIGKPIFIIIPPKRVNDFADILERIKCGERIKHHEAILARRDGTNIEISVSVSPIIDKKGEIIGASSIARDITERERAVNALREKEEMYRLLADISAESILVLQDGMIQTVNSRGTTITGFSDQELTSKLFLTLVHPDDRALIQERHQKRLRGEAVPNGYDFRVLTKDGRIKWVQVSAVAIKWEGRPATLNLLTDITERKHAEELLEIQKQQLSETNRKLTILSSLNRHDLTNQLSIIKACSDLAMKNIDPETKELIEMIAKAGESMKEQLEFAKAYQNLGATEPEWIEVRSSMSRAIESLNVGGISVRIDVSNIKILADRMLEKVFYNLVDNSIRHGGKVKNIRIFSEESSDGLRIVFEDDGIGIKVEDKERIFERGFGKNTGLGLYLCRAILALTGASIKENGKFKSGARFEIVIPPSHWAHT